jgi:MoxR-like ATPase
MVEEVREVPASEAAARRIRETAERLKANIEKVIVGKDEVIELVLVALLCEGHMLIEDVPGIGKTTLAKAIARSLDCSFKRIQFTPDLMPSDVTGVNFYNQRSGEFEFRPGPVIAQIVLADEINRATPRTQSSLLEAMEERQLTIEGETIKLPQPFLVLATQNPIELEGTFPLPEAQLDRFLIRIGLGYPSEEDEDEILIRFEKQNPLETLSPVINASQLSALSDEVASVHCEPAVRRYIVQLVQATRVHPAFDLGASPRASLALFRTSRALAAIRGRDYVEPDDIKFLAPFVIAHRLILSSQTRLRNRDVNAVLKEIIETVAVPVEN